MIDEKTEAGLQMENKVIEDKLVSHENDDSPASRSQRRPIDKGEKTPAFKSAEVDQEQRMSPFIINDGKPSKNANLNHAADHLSPPTQSLGAFDLTEESKVATQDDAAEKSDENESSFEQR